MKIRQQRFGTVDVIIPEGPLTVEDGEEFMQFVSQQLTNASPRMVLCMREVPYLDSYGLEMLLVVARDLRGRRLNLKMTTLTPTCREIFNLTELLGEFEVFDEVEDAVRSFI